MHTVKRDLPYIGPACLLMLQMKGFYLLPKHSPNVGWHENYSILFVHSNEAQAVYRYDDTLILNFFL